MLQLTEHERIVATGLDVSRIILSPGCSTL